MKSMKVALVHDYLAQDGGAESVLRALHEMWPEAPIFVLFNKKGSVQGIPDTQIRESFFRFLPFGRTRYQWYLPWMPLATERHNLHEYDVVISSTSAFAKGVLTRPNTLHISYCHTPTRYLWTDTHEYIAELRYNRIIKSLLPPILHRMRMWDKASADRVDHFVANSQTVKKRIAKYYRRPSDVIYPPAHTKDFFISPHLENYFLTGGRIVPYKRFDLVVQAFNRLGLPLKIFGIGPDLDRLKKYAKPNIEFLGRVNDQEKAQLMSKAQAFIHPQVEDLGITPIESMASGRPVIAYGVGGVTETVVPGKTGVFFQDQNWESLFDAVVHFSEQSWDPSAIREHAQKFSVDHFSKQMRQYVHTRYDEFLETVEYLK